MLVHLENEDFNEMIKDDLVIVDFYANWCGPCKMLSPVLEEISSLRDNVKVVKVDVDKHNELARKYGIMSIPTLMYFKNGNLEKTTLGFISKEQIMEYHKKAVKAFYLRPMYILKMLLKIRSPYEIKSYFLAGMKILLNK